MVSTWRVVLVAQYRIILDAMNNSKVRSLKEHEGELIVALIPLFDPKLLQEIRLLRVEEAGIWIENQKAHDMYFNAVGAKSSPKTMIFFVPWPQITFVLSSLDVPAISETFGQ